MKDNQHIPNNSLGKNSTSKSFIQKHKFLLLSGFCALGLTVTGTAVYSFLDNSESGEIGRYVGKYYQKIQAERNVLDNITEQASAVKKDYTDECYHFATEIYSLAKRASYESPQEIIDFVCAQQSLKHQNNLKINIIIEDLQAIKKFFDGTNKDLMNVICYYHSSPEIPFHNRYSEPAQVRDGIYRYELKSRAYLREKHNIVSKSMFDTQTR